MTIVTDARTTQFPTPTGSDFDRETKWCEACQTQVRFLASVSASYCIQCGGKVRLFSPVESVRFADAVQRKKYCSA
ncbi:MAG: hypothetical protein IPK26_03825 [Planctomycetes bacterium]|nr:hypothetical protein [Planctomycetota bacterium]